MSLLESADPAYAEALSRIKGALDPNGILAPGRYEPARTAAAELS
jgi:FAD/FMN-containing dehydrogenase